MCFDFRRKKSESRTWQAEKMSCIKTTKWEKNNLNFWWGGSTEVPPLLDDDAPASRSLGGGLIDPCRAGRPCRSQDSSRKDPTDAADPMSPLSGLTEGGLWLVVLIFPIVLGVALNYRNFLFVCRYHGSNDNLQRWIHGLHEDSSKGQGRSFNSSFSND